MSVGGIRFLASCSAWNKQASSGNIPHHFVILKTVNRPASSDHPHNISAMHKSIIKQAKISTLRTKKKIWMKKMLVAIMDFPKVWIHKVNPHKKLENWRQAKIITLQMKIICFNDKFGGHVGFFKSPNTWGEFS